MYYATFTPIATFGSTLPKPTTQIVDSISDGLVWANSMFVGTVLLNSFGVSFILADHFINPNPAPTSVVTSSAAVT